MELLPAWEPYASGVNNIESEILRVESDICAFAISDSDLSSHSYLTNLHSKLAALHRQSNSRWAQRAHMLWLMNGDKNSKFFHHITRSCSHYNFISQVTDPDDIIHTDQSDILHTFSTFYSKLWTAPSVCDLNILEFLHDDIPKLSNAERSSLISEVTKEEVYLTILDLPPGKSPGPDGFNIEFYRTFWPVIGNHLFLAIKYFFDNSVLPSSWGNTSIIQLQAHLSLQCLF